MCAPLLIKYCFIRNRLTGLFVLCSVQCALQLQNPSAANALCSSRREADKSCHIYLHIHSVVAFTFFVCCCCIWSSNGATVSRRQQQLILSCVYADFADFAPSRHAPQSRVVCRQLFFNNNRYVFGKNNSLCLGFFFHLTQHNIFLDS